MVLYFVGVEWCSLLIYVRKARATCFSGAANPQQEEATHCLFLFALNIAVKLFVKQPGLVSSHICPKTIIICWGFFRRDSWRSTYITINLIFGREQLLS